MARAGRGRIYVWPGASLWTGTALGQTDVHAHHAVQVTLALDAPVGFAFPRVASVEATSLAFEDHAAIVIASNCPHALDGRGRHVAQLFVEPESGAGRALTRLAGAGGHAPLDAVPATALGRSLGAFASAQATRDAAITAARAAIDALVAGAAPVPAVDARIVRALALVRERLDAPLALETIARDVHLSAGRFRHLFVAQTGISFRGYVLWQRLQRALEQVEAGASLTVAAHAGGFADLAHLSRTFRRVFGIVPSGIEIEG